MSECKNCDKWVILGAWKPIMMSLGCKGKPCGWRRKSHPWGPDTEWRNSEDLEKMMSVLAVSSWGGGCGGWRWMAEELNSFFTDMTAERKTKKKKRHSADHSTYSTDTLKKVNCSWFLGTLNRRNVNAPPTALAQQLHHRQPVNIQTHQDEGWRLYLQDDRNNIHIERCAVSSRTGHLVDTAVARSAFYKLILDTASKPRRWSWHKWVGDMG